MQVSYDHRAICIDGQRQLILSGAVHYPRSTPEMWPAIFQHCKDAGLNTIETYVFWNLHEPKQGKLDFQGRLDLIRFCQLAREMELYIILRIGPYICAETNYGGFPAWLRDVPGIQMRTSNEPFEKHVNQWVSQLCERIRPYFASQDGPIIMAQMENEYNNIAKYYGEQGHAYLQRCAVFAESLELGIPWIMCAGAPSGTLETINDFHAHRQIDEHLARNPNHPLIWSECWTGWYDLYGYPHHRRPAENLAYAAARFFAAGGSGINYYMWHGGTNFAREGMFLHTASYDFSAPLDEYGMPTTKSRHLTHLHHVLTDHTHLLLGMDSPSPHCIEQDVLAYVYEERGQGLTFLCHDGLQSVHVTWRARQHTLAGQSVLILNEAGDAVYDSHAIAPADCVTREIQMIQPALQFHSVATEPLPTQRVMMQEGRVHSSKQPIEQLSLTKDLTDYCWYQTQVRVSAAESGLGTLRLEGVADRVYVFINCQYCVTTPEPISECRGPIDGVGFVQSFELKLPQGVNDLSLLCCAMGMIKGDWMIGHQNMVLERKGFWGKAYWNENQLVGDWNMIPGVMGESLLASDNSLSRLPGNQIGRLRWWQASFQKPVLDKPVTLDLKGMGNGAIWLNGHLLSRYSLTTVMENNIPDVDPLIGYNNGLPTQRYYHLPLEWLEPENVLILFEETNSVPDNVELCHWNYY